MSTEYCSHLEVTSQLAAGHNASVLTYRVTSFGKESRLDRCEHVVLDGTFQYAATPKSRQDPAEKRCWPKVEDEMMERGRVFEELRRLSAPGGSRV